MFNRLKTSRLLKTLAYTVGIIYVISSLTPVYSVSPYIKILFHINILVLYTTVVKKTKPLVYLFFISSMIGEFLYFKSFITYYLIIITCFTISFSSGIYLLFPLIKKVSFKYKITDILGIILLVLGLGYIIGSVYFMSAKETADYTFFSIVTIAFSLFIATCFYITAFYRHPKRILLFVTGVGYIVNCLVSLFYTLYFKEDFLPIIGVINTGEIVAQLSFIYFMIHYDVIAKGQDWAI